ncbi:PD-(D/E)XK nuclease family protein [Spirochaeta dissipatitropha]
MRINSIAAARIAGCLPDSSHVFVFPSEIIAAQWRMYSLRELCGGRAVDARRWISWDECKQFILRPLVPGGEDLVPANGAVRVLCADALLQRQLLKRLVPENASAGSFRRFLARVLPVSLRMRDSAVLDEAVGIETAQDIRCLADEYEAFLARFGMYEPSAVSGSIDSAGAVYHVFSPELLEDLPELLPELRKHGDVHLEFGRGGADGAAGVAGVGGQTAATGPTGSEGAAGAIGAIGSENPDSLASFADSRHQPVPLVWYPNVKAEVRALMDRVEALLSRGVAWSEIVVTAADMDAVMPYIEREAALRGLPVSGRQGLPLAESPGAALFSGLQALGGGAMEYAAVRDLLLHRRIPWRRPDNMRALAAFGRHWRCWGRFGKDDLWEDAFRRAGSSMLSREFGEEGSFWTSYPEADGLDDLKDLYRSLKNLSMKMSSAKSFSELRQVFFRWYSLHVDAEAWDEAGEREFQSCLSVLGDLIRMEERLAVAVSAPFQIFMEMLGEKLYLQAGGRGVAVYPYRVAAGGYAPYHFVVNLHQDASEVLSGGLNFLRDDQQEKLGIEVRDMSADFLAAYMSGGSEVCFSGNAGIRGLVHAVPSYYLDNSDFLIDGFADGSADDPGCEVREQLWWAGKLDDPDLYLRQFRGLQSFLLTGGQEQGFDCSREAFSAAADADFAVEAAARLADLLKTRYQHEGLWALSASALKSVGSNPASLLLRLLGIEHNEEWEPGWFLPLDTGNLYHTALEWIFSPEAESSFLLDPLLLESQLNELSDLLGRKFIPWRSRLTLLEQGFELATLRQTLQELIPELDPSLDQAKVAGVEVPLLQLDTEFNIYWKGRIDRLDRVPADGRVLIYDYKRSGIPAGKQLRPLQIDASDPFPMIAEPQMAVYLRCASLMGEDVAAARFVSILKNAGKISEKLRDVVLQEDMQRPGKKPRKQKDDPYAEEGWPALFAALQLQTRDFTERLTALDFSLVDSSGKQLRSRFLQSSDYRQILRHRYRVR